MTLIEMSMCTSTTCACENVHVHTVLPFRVYVNLIEVSYSLIECSCALVNLQKNKINNIRKKKIFTSPSVIQ